jgi:hypothetical protein
MRAAWPASSARRSRICFVLSATNRMPRADPYRKEVYLERFLNSNVPFPVLFEVAFTSTTATSTCRRRKLLSVGLRANAHRRTAVTRRQGTNRHGDRERRLTIRVAGGKSASAIELGRRFGTKGHLKMGEPRRFGRSSAGGLCQPGLPPARRTVEPHLIAM